MIEYKVRPVTRFVVTRYEETGMSGSSTSRGEFDNSETAYQVAYALAKADAERLGLPPGDPSVIFPEPILSPKDAFTAELAEMDKLIEFYRQRLHAQGILVP